MAQNGFSRRTSTATRTYPGTASRLVGSPLAGQPSSRNSSSAGSEPIVFVRPLSRSHLAPVHAVGSASDGRAPTPPARPISLDQPRPSSERHRNLYLGAPILQHHSSGANSSNSKNRIDSSVTAAEQVRLPTNSRKKGKNTSDTSSQDEVVTTQPTKRSLLVDSTDSSGKVKLAESSIVCPYCRKCRCEACATPRPLPSRWICSKSIHCGPEPLLDYLTCLCCVKAVFYHCGKNHEPDGGVICADKPCSCAPHRKFWRWGCMTAMSLLLPCLCLYWPCKVCIHVAEKTYQRYHSNGCTCRSPGCGNSRNGVADTSEDEDRASSHFSHPPVVTGRIGSNKLLPSD
ncbi:unnamed protein product [Allacma fusca]|uniref:Sprouty n=1 Tax=Allacma fusca TaxID=39272 RepID=A0A8J2LLS4_9HEXA|nr:unnamed protein product [Allacma fusca]